MLERTGRNRLCPDEVLHNVMVGTRALDPHPRWSAGSYVLPSLTNSMGLEFNILASEF